MTDASAIFLAVVAPGLILILLVLVVIMLIRGRRPVKLNLSGFGLKLSVDTTDGSDTESGETKESKCG